jgi:hypothetical protein
MSSKKLEVLKLLFNNNDKTCVGGAKSTNVVSPFEVAGEFYAVNALAAVDLDFKKKEHYAYMKPRRADINVKSFRNFIFEIDSLSLEQQLKVIEECGIEFSAVVYSGGKSYHCLICLENCLGGVHTKSGIDEYKRIWTRIAAKIDSTSLSLGFDDKVVDPSCKNPSRFTRYPEFKAVGRDIQTIVSFADSRISNDQFNVLLKTCPELKIEASSKAINMGDVDSIKEFWSISSTGLKNAIRYPIWARSSAGLYPEALKIVLWAIDETNVDQELLIRIFEKSVFRQYERVGYPREKWYTAIEDGYRFKG